MRYITIAPRNPKGRWIVARTGAGGEHYYNAAETYSEGTAKRICAALQALDNAEEREELISKAKAKIHVTPVRRRRAA